MEHLFELLKIFENFPLYSLDLTDYPLRGIILNLFIFDLLVPGY